MPRTPQFICIGVQKSATTWLCQMLRKHPQVWFPSGTKEVHFFDREILKRPRSWYDELFDDPNGMTSIPGEKTPNYSALKKQSIAYIRRAFPDVKLILILRRPDERSWSHARMEVSDYNKRSLQNRDICRCVFQIGTLRNSRLTDYHRILTRWRTFFPSEQILVLFHDDIEREPRSVLCRVSRFLGLSEYTEWSDERLALRVWSSPEIEMPPVVRWYLQRRYRSVVEQIATEFPTPARQWFEPLPESLRVSLSEKWKIIFIANVATIPFNLAYLCYDLFRDFRMYLRLKYLDRTGPPTSAHAQRQENLSVMK